MPRISPDGRILAFNATDAAGKSRIWVRPLNAPRPSRSPGPREPSAPSGRPTAASSVLRRRKAEEGRRDRRTAQKICDAPAGSDGTWSPEGVILFDGTASDPIQRVPAAGGTPPSWSGPRPRARSRRSAGRSSCRTAKHFLYMVASLGGVAGADSNVIRVGSLDGREDRLLVRALSNAQYAADRLLYVRDETLVAQSLDTSAWAVKGEPVPIEPRVVRTTDWAGFYAFSASRETIVFAPLFGVVSVLAWFDRSGKSGGSVGQPQTYGSFRLSPDERRVVATVLNPSKNKTELWTVDVASGATAKLVAGARQAYVPIWSRDGSRVFFLFGCRPLNPPEHLGQADRRRERAAVRREWRQPDSPGLVAGRPVPRRAQSPARGKAIQRALGISRPTIPRAPGSHSRPKIRTRSTPASLRTESGLPTLRTRPASPRSTCGHSPGRAGSGRSRSRAAFCPSGGAMAKRCSI